MDPSKQLERMARAFDALVGRQKPGDLLRIALFEDARYNPRCPPSMDLEGFSHSTSRNLRKGSSRDVVYVGRDEYRIMVNPGWDAATRAPDHPLQTYYIHRLAIHSYAQLPKSRR